MSLDGPHKSHLEGPAPAAIIGISAEVVPVIVSSAYEAGARWTDTA